MELPQGDSDACHGFDGNPDLYGIGIRIGVYLSWYTSLTANLWANTFVDELSDTNTLFILANVVAVTFGASRHAISSVEAFIVLCIFAGYFFGSWTVAGLRVGAFCTSTASESKFDGRTVRIYKHLYFRFLGGFSVAGFALRLCLVLAAAAFSTWFFFHGADVLRKDMCGYKIFLFGAHPLFGPVRAFLKVYSVLVCVLLGIIYMPAFIYLFIYVMVPVTGTIAMAICCAILCGKEDQLSCGKVCAAAILGGGIVTNLAMAELSLDAESLRTPSGKRLQRCLGIDGYLSTLLLSGVAFILRNHRRIMGLVGLVTSTWTIVVIEMTVKVNDIRGVNELAQTSQLIPFVLGCALFLGTVRRAIIQRVILDRANDKEPSIRVLSPAPGSIRSRHGPQGEGKPVETARETVHKISKMVNKQPQREPRMGYGVPT